MSEFFALGGARLRIFLKSLRSRERPEGEFRQPEPADLSAGSYMLHDLPDGFRPIRHYGFHANGSLAAML